MQNIQNPDKKMLRRVMLYGWLPLTEKNESALLTPLTALKIMCQIVHDKHSAMQNNANFDDVVMSDISIPKVLIQMILLKNQTGPWSSQYY